ncbi:hypothetical protein DPMN_101683 [Dreissena polymorpha]|uniref:Uncharacterized protein n=1 Tax=Dreissena polymorpha TaxID=45954 RepID=A0A9D4R9Y5_DREPO|nr:hypothetical protein DPMN_101683 [Dreissena polymorpha]
MPADGEMRFVDLAREQFVLTMRRFVMNKCFLSSALNGACVGLAGLVVGYIRTSDLRKASRFYVVPSIAFGFLASNTFCNLRQAKHRRATPLIPQ